MRPENDPRMRRQPETPVEQDPLRPEILGRLAEIHDQQQQVHDRKDRGVDVQAAYGALLIEG